MKLRNFEVKDEKDKKELNLIPKDFRMLISGKSGCDKTSNLIHMLTRPLLNYNKIYLHTLSSHQTKIKNFKRNSIQLVKALDMMS